MASRRAGEPHHEGPPEALLDIIQNSVACLVITDVQRDFCEGGALGGEGRREMVLNINRLRCWRTLCGAQGESSCCSDSEDSAALRVEDIADELFEHVVITRDWHPYNHLSFARSHTVSCNPEACTCGDEEESDSLREPPATAAITNAVRSQGTADTDVSVTETKSKNKRSDVSSGSNTSHSHADSCEGPASGVDMPSARKGGFQEEPLHHGETNGVVEESIQNGEHDARTPRTSKHLSRNQVRRKRSGTVLDLWPVHCVQNTPGAELHPELLTLPTDVPIYKATNREEESYSCFGSGMSQTPLAALLQEWKVETVCVVGLCIDFCVSATAYAALEVPGIRTVCVLTDCSKSVFEENTPKVSEAMRNKGIRVCTTAEMFSRKA
ncbi:nicotinamidase [Cystoisospora suis]|uniref:nicotinamidase n=1 Tax=Cystoisospora suis TaxID=483139 RepID=A0A2C6KC73_9APIC|nr:nicotinamidase [Cystoisospora suis]